MPVHDWTRVPPGTFHDFHVSWVPMLRDVLNEGVLPAGYYAMAEQATGVSPDVLTLQAIDDGEEQQPDDFSGGGTTLVATPPQTTVKARLELERSIYAARANHLVIRHHSHDRVVAILEVVSSGNKSSQSALNGFITKATAALLGGVHLLVIDMHPPTRRDPHGLHGVIWDELGGDEYHSPPGKPLACAAYSALGVGWPIEAFVEPLAVGDPLPAMPLFLAHGRHVAVPLETSYMIAVSKIPLRARKPLE